MVTTSVLSTAEYYAIQSLAGGASLGRALEAAETSGVSVVDIVRRNVSAGTIISASSDRGG
jgi:hypothetical protein